MVCVSDVHDVRCVGCGCGVEWFCMVCVVCGWYVGRVVMYGVSGACNMCSVSDVSAAGPRRTILGLEWGRGRGGGSGACDDFPGKFLGNGGSQAQVTF